MVKSTVRGILIVAVLWTALWPVGTGRASEETTGDPAVGLHLAAYLLYEYDWTAGSWADEQPWKRNVARNIKWLAGRGYTVLLVDVMDTEHGGTFFFECPLLKDNGYHPGPAMMEFLVEEAHRHNLTVFADPTVLAWALDKYQVERYALKGRPLTVDQVKAVAAVLLDRCGFDGIVEECFPWAYIAGIHEETGRRGKRYIHKFDDPYGHEDILMSEDYVGFLSSPQGAAKVDETGAAMNTLGFFNALFGHAKALGVPGWVKVGGNFDLPDGAERNVFLLRAVQFQPDGYFWMPFQEDKGIRFVRRLDVQELAARLNRLRGDPGPRPVANLVLPYPLEGEEPLEEWALFLSQTIGPVTNGLMLAGYDIRTSYGDPLPDADMFVVLAMGETEAGDYDLTDSQLSVLDDSRPVIFVAHGLTDTGNWEKALPKLGIRADWSAMTVHGRIDFAMYQGRRIPWSGYPIWEYPVQTSLLDLEDVSGRILVPGSIKGRETALVVKQGNKYLVNGNVLHLQVAYIINGLFGQTLNAPFFGYGTVGKRSAFLALADTDLDVNLPFEPGRKIRIIEYNSHGRLSRETTMEYTAPFKTRMKKHHLIIVEG